MEGLYFNDFPIFWFVQTKISRYIVEDESMKKNFMKHGNAKLDISFIWKRTKI